MEIFSFLHLTTSRLLLMLGVAVVAAVPTAMVLSDSADSFQAESTVFATRALPASSSSFEVAPFVGDFETLLTLEPITDEIAASAGMSPFDLALETERSTDGSALTIRAIAPTIEGADTAAQTAAAVGLQRLLEQEIERARRAVSVAETAATDAAADLEEFRSVNSVQDPVEEFRLTSDSLAFAQTQSNSTVLDASARARAQDQLPVLEARLLELAPLRTPYEDLDRALVRSEDAAADARRSLLEAEQQVAASSDTSLVVNTPAQQVSSSTATIAGVLALLVVVGVLSIVGFALIDTLRTRRAAQARAAETTDDVEASDGETIAAYAGDQAATPTPARTAPAPASTPAPATAAASSAASSSATPARSGGSTGRTASERITPTKKAAAASSDTARTTEKPQRKSSSKQSARKAAKRSAQTTSRSPGTKSASRTSSTTRNGSTAPSSDSRTRSPGSAGNESKPSGATAGKQNGSDGRTAPTDS